jgi:hypothetical protein
MTVVVKKCSRKICVKIMQRISVHGGDFLNCLLNVAYLEVLKFSPLFLPRSSPVSYLYKPPTRFRQVIDVKHDGNLFVHCPSRRFSNVVGSVFAIENVYACQRFVCAIYQYFLPLANQKPLNRSETKFGQMVTSPGTAIRLKFI